MKRRDPYLRPAAVAGRFYPGDPSRLRREVEQHLSEAVAYDGPVPKAIIAPHAGYPYSGPVAGTAFATLLPARATIRRIVLVGPAHYVPVEGLAASSATAFSTPLGDVPVDEAAMETALKLANVATDDEAHRPEHALEVELPFLQAVLDDFTIVPLLVGEVVGREVSALLERLWGGPETCLVISSDLSHYLSYDEARAVDGGTAAMIERMDVDPLGPTDACGCEAIRGLVPVARQKGLRARQLDLRNSGDTAGSRTKVVGYGAFVFA